jgi:GntR family galactonate operon transcriptional repressor
MKLPREMLSQMLAKDLTRMIIEDGMQPGTKIPSEAELAKMFEVSRTVVREGIQEIVGMGLVLRSQGKSTQIAPRENWDLLNPKLLAIIMANDGNAQAIFDDLFAVRILIESHAAAEAATRRTEEDIALLEKWLQRMRKCVNDAAEFMKADLEYHAAVQIASHDLVVSSILRVMRDLLEASRTFTQQEPPALPTALKQHEECFSAIQAGDAEAAYQAMGDHLRWSQDVSVFKFRQHDKTI